MNPPQRQSLLDYSRDRKFLFWNIHGINNLPDIHHLLNLQDILCICETWNEVEGVPFVNINFFDFIQAPARRIHKQGRARGGLLIIFNAKIDSMSVIFKFCNHIFDNVFGSLITNLMSN